MSSASNASTVLTHLRISTILLGPKGEISSNPQPCITTAWSTLPTSIRLCAIKSCSPSSKTPMTARWAPAAFVIGPKMLKALGTEQGNRQVELVFKWAQSPYLPLDGTSWFALTS